VFVRDFVTLDPPLYCRMISMAELAGHRADTTAFADQVCVGHTLDVHSLRTHVNVESVRGYGENAHMADGDSLGAKLRELQQRSGRSYEEIAAKAGYKTKSGVQRYFSEDYDAAYLPLPVAEKLARAFEGTRVPPDAVMALAGFPATNARVQKFEGAADVTLERDLPIYGTALGAPRNFDGKAVEQTMLNRGEIIDYARRPTVLNGQRAAYGLYVQGTSMEPRFDDGELIFVTDSRKARPASIGDHVVVYLRDEDFDDGETASAVLVKRLVRRGADQIELQQYEPALTFKLETSRVLRIDRVIPWGELLSS
jgi:transcriptional regulator with XRE-family HTH domain